MAINDLAVQEATLEVGGDEIDGTDLGEGPDFSKYFSKYAWFECEEKFLKICSDGSITTWWSRNFSKFVVTVDGSITTWWSTLHPQAVPEPRRWKRCTQQCE